VQQSIIMMHKKQDNFAQKCKAKCLFLQFSHSGAIRVSMRKKTVNQHHYAETLWYLQEYAQEKQSERWNLGDWFLHHDNALANCTLSVNEFMARCKMIIIPHPTYSSGLATPNFFHFAKSRWG
jgi:hypothetical protein